MQNAQKFFQNTGAIFLLFFEKIGKVFLFAANAVKAWFNFKNYYPKNIWREMVDIGFYSLPVVGITAIFTGAVLALQSYSSASRFSAQNFIATVVVLSITRELGPVLAGLMVAGRVGASIAAEIGTMRVTEQIDALETLSTNPIYYLVSPKLMAATIMLPFLVLIADIIGIFGGYIVSVGSLGFSSVPYLKNTFEYLEAIDVISGLVKASAFGFIVALMGCYHGFHSDKGAQGVGKATTNAVVSSSILILCANYFITQLFFAN
ncbi:MAG: ABC transporter permease [Sphingobacteriia bacterium]|nr:ABC transporter permease [Sphingobacteriia bacterium]